MSRRFATAVAIAVLGLGAPAAYAGEPSRSAGSCGFDAVSQESVTGADRFVGVAYAAVRVYSPTGAVVSADVTCRVAVDGVTQATASGSGTSVVAVAGRIEYTATDTQVVELCTVVDYTSDDTPTEDRCENLPLLWPFYPPWWLYEFVDTALSATEGRICEATGGDVYVGDELLWDCAPYRF